MHHGLAFAQDARNRSASLAMALFWPSRWPRNVFQGGVTDDVLTQIAGNPFRAGVPEHDLSRAVDEVHSCRHVFPAPRGRPSDRQEGASDALFENLDFSTAPLVPRSPCGGRVNHSA